MVCALLVTAAQWTSKRERKNGRMHADLDLLELYTDSSAMSAMMQPRT